MAENPDVVASLEAKFREYGLESLWSKVLELIADDWDASNLDAFMVQLESTDEYKKRFRANDARVKAGLNPLKPSEYVQLEQTYRQLMQDAALVRPGFYDRKEDFAQFIEKDISPAELQDRVRGAVEATRSSNPETLKALQDYYGVGPDGVTAWFLDPERARVSLEQQYSAATFSGIAQQMGVGIDKSTAELAAESGVIGMGDYQQARQGLSQVAAESQSLANLGSIYGDGMTDAENIQATFDIGSTAAGASAKKRKLASRERAAFAGASGVQSGSLTSSSAGKI